MRKTKLALKLRSPKLKCWFAPQVYLDCMVCWSCIIWKKFPILPKGMLNPPPPTGTFNHFNKEMGGGGYRSFPFPCELQVGFFFSWSTEEVRAIFPCTSVLQKDHEVREVRVLFMNYEECTIRFIQTAHTKCKLVVCCTFDLNRSFSKKCSIQDLCRICT